MVLHPVLARLYYEIVISEAVETCDLALESDRTTTEANMYKSLSLLSLGKKKWNEKDYWIFAKRIKRLYPDTKPQFLRNSMKVFTIEWECSIQTESNTTSFP